MPMAPEPVYLDLVSPIKNVLLMRQMKREEEEKKIRNALMQQQVTGLQNQNALFPMQLEEEKRKAQRQREIDYLLKMPDDPEGIKTFAAEGEKLGIFRPAEHNKKRPDQWTPEDASAWGKKTLGQGLDITSKYEVMYGAQDKIKQKLNDLMLPYAMGLKETPEQERTAKEAAEKVWIFNPKTGMKEQVSQQEAKTRVSGGEWKRGQPVSATRVKMNPKTGELEFISGPMGAEGAEGMTKKTQGAVEEDLLKLNNSYARMHEITKRLYDPKFLDIKNRWSALKTSWSSKMGGDVSEENKKALGELSKFRRRTMLEFNQWVKDWSGVAVRPDELPRYQASIPYSGTGVFDGDSAIEFEAKSSDFMKDQERAIARLNYVRKHGLKNINEIELDDVDKLIQDRAAEIKSKKPDIPRDELKTILMDEFGLRF